MLPCGFGRAHVKATAPHAVGGMLTPMLTSLFLHACLHAAAGRYHLYISLACPWANRCLAVRNLKVRSMSIAHGNGQERVRSVELGACGRKNSVPADAASAPVW